jgi:hypothetical protein
MYILVFKSLKLMRIILFLFLTAICILSCKKKNFHEARLEYSCPQPYARLDSSDIYIYDVIPECKVIMKIENQGQLDSLSRFTSDINISSVDLSSEVIYFFHVSYLTNGCFEFQNEKIKINDSDKNIEFFTKIKADDNGGAYYYPFVGYLIIPRANENYSIAGRLKIVRPGSGPISASTRSDKHEFSWTP